MTDPTVEALVEKVRERIPELADFITALQSRCEENEKRVELMALAISDALGRYQVTHIHEGLRTAMKDMP